MIEINGLYQSNFDSQLVETLKRKKQICSDGYNQSLGKINDL